ncbi:hypothetical protein CO174_05500 [Candidatus Uhrbacteria bacterium CG_4_9_14_3_um_filter_50_9]|uniref:Uncharacterized protein n=1 Tax=Candidatus Uhrbacteria bacterium CG_4_9_14_3_um_filter_50_9 TaxID=1975035 RepID=A0A2M7XAX2_9BACT|nr:MAG: hypothetical protein CO174_05500 [Candidatus Uhrbacteria bacterium CG_4_9_14_3_um_filter_50_9]
MQERFTGTVSYRRMGSDEDQGEGVMVEIITTRSMLRRRVIIPGLGEGIFRMSAKGIFEVGHWSLAPECQICDLRGQVKGNRTEWIGTFTIERDGEVLVKGSLNVNKAPTH